MKRVVLAIALSVFLIASPAIAKNMKKAVKGEILGVKGAYVQVKVGAQPVVFKVETAPANVQVVGTAEPGWVNSGMAVNFNCKISGKNIVAEPVTELTVFTPTESIVPGISKEGSAGLGSSEGGGLFDNIGTAPAAEENDEPVSANVIGLVQKKGRDGRLTVVAGKETVTFEFAENAKVSVDVFDPRYIRMGDKIEGTAHYDPEKKGSMPALKEKIKVTAAQVFKGPEVKKRRVVTKTTEKKEAAAEEKPVVAAEKKPEEKKEAPAEKKPEEPKSIFDL